MIPAYQKFDRPFCTEKLLRFSDAKAPVVEMVAIPHYRAAVWGERPSQRLPTHIQAF